MKKCPNCNQSFSDDNDFCLNDGTPLISDNTSQPTLIVNTPSSTAHPFNRVEPGASTGSSNMLYLVIGILATALVAVGVYAFLILENETTKRTEGSNSPVTTVASSATPSLKPDATAILPPPPAPLATNPGLTPSGNWSGDWSGRSSAFTATASFSEVNGAVTGQIVWTLQKSSNPAKSYKVGLTATEYVRGTYDAVTRLMKVKGIRKDDPNKLVIYDQYNLSLSENGDLLSGVSKNGNFRLRR